MINASQWPHERILVETSSDLQNNKNKNKHRAHPFDMNSLLVPPFRPCAAGKGAPFAGAS